MAVRSILTRKYKLKFLVRCLILVTLGDDVVNTLILSLFISKWRRSRDKCSKKNMRIAIRSLHASMEFKESNATNAPVWLASMHAWHILKAILVWYKLPTCSHAKDPSLVMSSNKWWLSKSLGWSYGFIILFS